jgi:hypothetical protein
MPRRLAAVLTAFVLGLAAASCGDEEGSRENVERGNLGNTSEGPSTVETGPTTLGSTGEDQPEITQTQTAPYP